MHDRHAHRRLGRGGRAQRARGGRRPVPDQAVLPAASAPARRSYRQLTLIASRPMKLGLHIGYWGLGMTARGAARARPEAERLGYDSVWTAEAYGSDAATILAWLAQATTRIKLGSAIFQMPGRSAAMTAMTAATIDQLSDGRMLLGHRHERAAGRRGLARPALRPPAPAHARVRRGGAAWRSPASASCSRARRSSCRCPTGRARRSSSRSRRCRSGSRSTSPRSGRRTRRSAAEIADGWIPTLFSPEHVGEFRPLLEEGFARAGGGKGVRRLRHRADRQRDTSPTTSTPRATRCARYVALYVGGMGSRKQNFYNALVAALRLRGRRARGPGPLPRGQARGGDGGAARRADRHWSRCAGRPTWCASGWRSSATRASAR